VNLSRYKRLENCWARALANGQSVSVNVRINYEGNSLRPCSFDVFGKCKCYDKVRGGKRKGNKSCGKFASLFEGYKVTNLP
jgi:hypothetical protein